MRRLIIVPFAGSVAALSLLIGAFVPTTAHAETRATRFGTLSTDADNRLLLNRRAVSPAVLGNNYLSFVETYEFADHDLVLVRDNGGEACPAMFYIVRVSRAGAVPAGPFGTCSDDVTTARTPAGLTLSMPGFAGPMEPEAAQLRAARTPHRYSYANGRVTEVLVPAASRRRR